MQMINGYSEFEMKLNRPGLKIKAQNGNEICLGARLGYRIDSMEMAPFGDHQAAAPAFLRVRAKLGRPIELLYCKIR